MWSADRRIGRRGKARITRVPGKFAMESSRTIYDAWKELFNAEAQRTPRHRTHGCTERINQALPISRPAMNTSTPPSMTCMVAENTGVSI